MLWVFCRCSCFFSASGIQTNTFYGGGVLEQASSIIVFIYLFMINPIVQLKDVGFETQCDPGLRETRGLWHRVWAGTCRGWATISKTVLMTYYTHTADVPSRKGERSARSPADVNGETPTVHLHPHISLLMTKTLLPMYDWQEIKG